MNLKKRIAIITLGCPRNLVDSEKLLSTIPDFVTIVDHLNVSVDIAIVNTCGFIEDAKKESIETLFELIELKKQKKIKYIFVFGCLVERYHDELTKEIIEIDGFFKITENQHLIDRIHAIYAIKISSSKIRKKIFPLSVPHIAYLKIAEGCNNKCSYCVLPSIKGSFKSRSLKDLTTEVESLFSQRRVSELNVIAQDTLAYGLDRYHKKNIVKLLKKISKMNKDVWIRLLYANPFHINDEIIECFQEIPNLCNYIDIPLQHVSDNILKRMRRPITEKKIISLINKLRKKVPGISLRTTFIVGFPGETKEDFNRLVRFIKEYRFDRVGVFTYSAEENTEAFHFKNSCSETVKKSRFDRIMKIQKKISYEKNTELLGTVQEILIDEIMENKKIAIARTKRDAYEIDGVAYVDKWKHLQAGDFAKMYVNDALEYDLVGEYIDEFAK